MADESHDPIRDLQKKIENARLALQKATSDEFIPAQFEIASDETVETIEAPSDHADTEGMASQSSLGTMVDLPIERYKAGAGIEDVGWFVPDEQSQDVSDFDVTDTMSVTDVHQEDGDQPLEFADPRSDTVGKSKEDIIKSTIGSMDIPEVEKPQLEKEVMASVEGAFKPMPTGKVSAWPPGQGSSKPRQQRPSKSADSTSAPQQEQGKQFAFDQHGRGMGNANPSKMYGSVSQQQAIQTGHSLNYADHVNQDLDVGDHLGALVSQTDVLTSSLADLVSRMTFAIQGLHGRVSDMIDRLDAESDLDEFGSGF